VSGELSEDPSEWSMGWRSGSDGSDMEDLNMRQAANSLPLRDIYSPHDWYAPACKRIWGLTPEMWITFTMGGWFSFGSGEMRRYAQLSHSFARIPTNRSLSATDLLAARRD
jgi:hypothetical protein